MIEQPEIARPLAVFTLACLNVILAFVHAGIIKRMATGGPKVKHGWWGWAYFGLVVGFGWLSGDKFGIGFDWLLVCAGITIRKPFFDTVLNLARGERWDYISPEVISCPNLKEAVKAGKTIDWLHYRIFRLRVWLYQLIYLGLTGVIIAIMIKG